jgi:hypothetical protein
MGLPWFIRGALEQLFILNVARYAYNTHQVRSIRIKGVAGRTPYSGRVI